MVTKTADCIDACTKTWGCRYWTVEKPLEKDSPVECYLKAWRGRQVATPGFISGSLPSACCEFPIYFRLKKKPDCDLSPGKETLALMLANFLRHPAAANRRG